MNNFSGLWAKPLLIAALSLSGLITALAGDGIWDVYSWIALGIPVVLMVRYWFYPTAKTKE
ncbi:MAG TPA: hypothetical protein VM802_02720 [Chitinophaga sp.]|uniref:hypothetical protein n=1 Tax=Chitinophaga sp. TaxID=1869181 RepID=UPI002CC4815D|nr:hypothetical protein [Chitinophaga sp.]HVI43750.1 hypothetical protein [Chitinophaga sp.]